MVCWLIWYIIKYTHIPIYISIVSFCYLYPLYSLCCFLVLGSKVCCRINRNFVTELCCEPKYSRTGSGLKEQRLGQNSSFRNLRACTKTIR